jgi:cytochrome c biogenesis factor
MRVTTAFKRLLRLDGVNVTAVEFLPTMIVVGVALRRRRLLCPHCEHKSRFRYDTRPVASAWRHLDLGVWHLELRANLRRLRCPTHGVVVEAVPFARPGARLTRDFDDLLAWLATRMDKTATARLCRVSRRLLAVGRQAVLLVLVAGLLAAGVMEWALLTHDFSLEYVARNGSRSTPVLYTVASLWGALEGSILLWALVLGGYLTAMVRRFRTRADDPLFSWALLTGLVVAAFFFGLMLGPANPFRLVGGVVPADGPGPNPLLQNHPLMAFHPPILYLGYVGFTVPFSFAVGALVTGRLGEGWLVEARRATLLAFGALTVGIVLGGWWSYEVLGWGGYWAWDPVENASFLPWLTATAYLHSVLVQERRGMLRVWNLSLLVATFCLTIFGTFLTRSGVINSVHSFTQSAIGPILLGFLVVVMVVSVGLIAWRADRLRSPGRIDSPLSREGAFLANNLLFAAFALVVLLGTVFPLVAEAYDGRQLSVGEPYFDSMTRPIGFVLLFLMAVAPALPWRAAGAGVLHRRLVGPAWVGALAMLAGATAGLRGLAPLGAVGLGAFALAGIARQFPWAWLHGAGRPVSAHLPPWLAWWPPTAGSTAAWWCTWAWCSSPSASPCRRRSPWSVRRRSRPGSPRRCGATPSPTSAAAPSERDRRRRCPRGCGSTGVGARSASTNRLFHVSPAPTRPSAHPRCATAGVRTCT